MLWNIQMQGTMDMYKNVKRVIDAYFERRLRRFCVELIEDAKKSRTYSSFTGQTATSYSCGVYTDGVLRYIASAGDGMRAPVFRKVRRGERVHLKRPYEGEARAVTGRVEVNDKSGQATAEDFLRGYKAPSQGWCVVMTTGTEYSEYLEQRRGLTVLRETAEADNVKAALLNNLTPIG